MYIFILDILNMNMFEIPMIGSCVSLFQIYWAWTCLELRWRGHVYLYSRYTEHEYVWNSNDRFMCIFIQDILSMNLTGILMMGACVSLFQTYWTWICLEFQWWGLVYLYSQTYWTWTCLEFQWWGRVYVASWRTPRNSCVRGGPSWGAFYPFYWNHNDRQWIVSSNVMLCHSTVTVVSH